MANFQGWALQYVLEESDVALQGIAQQAASCELTRPPGYYPGQLED
jgi:hypothetical protein